MKVPDLAHRRKGKINFKTEIQGDEYKLKVSHNEEPLLLLDDNEEPFTKNSYIAALKELHIGEWRRRYTTKRLNLFIYKNNFKKTTIFYIPENSSLRLITV